jgi:hypothetical protein
MFTVQFWVRLRVEESTLAYTFCVSDAYLHLILFYNMLRRTQGQVRLSFVSYEIEHSKWPAKDVLTTLVYFRHIICNLHLGLYARQTHDLHMPPNSKIWSFLFVKKKANSYFLYFVPSFLSLNQPIRKELILVDLQLLHVFLLQPTVHDIFT